MKRKVFAVIMAAVILMGVVASADVGTSKYLYDKIWEMKTEICGYLQFFVKHADALTDKELECWAELARLYNDLTNTIMIVGAEYFGIDPAKDYPRIDIGPAIDGMMTQYKSGETTRDMVVQYLTMCSKPIT